MPLGLGAALALGLGSAAISAGGAAAASGLSNKRSLQISREANKHNMKMWELNNEYNLPVNVMARFADAGLNPHLIYSNGAQGAVSQSPPSDYVAPEYSNPLAGTVNAFAQLPQLLMTIKQMQKVDADISYINARRLTEFQKMLLTSRQYQRLGQDIKKYDKLNGLLIEAQDIANKRADYALNNIDPAQYGKLVAETKYTNERFFEQHFRSNLAKQGINPNDSPESRLLQLLVFAFADKMLPSWRQYLNLE